MSLHSYSSHVARSIIPFPFDQPIPTHATVIYAKLDGGKTGTFLNRQWASMEDIAACRLCTLRKCVANGLTCSILVERLVTEQDARLFRDDGCQWVIPQPADSPAMEQAL